jgi:putative membrane protein
MKRFSILVAAIGLAVIAGAIVAANPRAVAAAIARVGPASLLVIATRAVSVGLCGLAWWLLFPPKHRPPARICMLLRYVREGANTLLPLTQIGGDVAGARLVTFWGIAGTLAAATVIVDVLMQAATQFLYALSGLSVLAARDMDSALVRNVGLALALFVPALGGFYLVQRHWGEALLMKVLRRMAGGREWALHGHVEAVFSFLHTLYGRRGALAATFVAHLAIWFIGALEVWIALTAMGHAVGYREALAIESLAQAARGAAFMVPSAVGVQEGGLVLLCGLFGIPAQSALAVSLIKRAADVAVGVPGLIAWQRLEAVRWTGKGKRAAGPN